MLHHKTLYKKLPKILHDSSAITFSIKPSIEIYKALLKPLVAQLLFLVLVILYPLVSTVTYKLCIKETNFETLSSANPLVLEKHIVSNGMTVTQGQPIGKIQFLYHSNQKRVTRILRSQQEGIYFGLAPEGSQLKAYQPVAKVLMKNDANLYFFKLNTPSEPKFKPGQTVSIQSGILSANGTIDSVLGPYQGNHFSIGIKLLPPFDIKLLNPSQSTKLILTANRYKSLMPIKVNNEDLMLNY